MNRLRFIVAIIAIFFNMLVAFSAECHHRGMLEEPYCDNDYDLIADLPTDPKQMITPQTLIVSFSPFEDLSPYSKYITRFTDHLATCLDSKVIYYQMQSNEAEIEAMRAGRLHVAGFSSGSTVAAVNRAGAVPFAAKGNEQGIAYSGLIVIARSDSPYQKITDLKGKRVAHTDAVSNSGHLGALALFPQEGIIPGVDYEVIFSGKHDLSIVGVKSGDYDAAVISAEVYERMIGQQRIKEGEFRIIYQSEPFPAAAITYSHKLAPEFREKLQQCIFDYRFSGSMQHELLGADRFVPINYQKDWAYIRMLLEEANQIRQEIFQNVAAGNKNGWGARLYTWLR
ncbi:phosphate/phosphite/phosphonate ABC transporter substrate-binding protein [Ignatzschineria ureiclastica]|uniref:Phosphate/phosphite/phosphonate ABC transporter substrate-binding protein n=1 Tax=Ignatzschineria ureiclastica TaxID=472582 RepID=A0A2U2AHG8_9GAMM|nr:phosphate/phosphite/phosphonate ABC transporter substrate-binding protein [Ignatzschineria ureiclastica]PWD82096.1 phosphate/phosphite/phosphonate ABC transporter substrate-binding protein [Ignatzschineria ureiclastica]